MAGASVILITFLGLALPVLLPFQFGTIIAAVITSLAIVGMSNGMKANNLRRLVETEDEPKIETPTDEDEDRRVDG